jgi:hypothetical protein
MVSYAMAVVCGLMWLSLGVAPCSAFALPPPDAGTSAPTIEKVSCWPERPRATVEQLLAPMLHSAGVRSVAQLRGTRLAWLPVLERCARQHPLPAGERKRVLQLGFTIEKSGALADIRIGKAHSQEFSACLTRGLAPVRHPLACEAVQISQPVRLDADLTVRTNALSRPSFWDWAELPVRAAGELGQRAEVFQRLLRNLNRGDRSALLLAFGEASFELQAYARSASPQELSRRQKGTLSAFVELVRGYPGHKREDDALLALVVSLAEMGDGQKAETFYDRLVTKSPTAQQTALAHLCMAERAARDGARELAVRRYARALEALSVDTAQYAYAYARRAELAREVVSLESP